MLVTIDQYNKTNQYYLLFYSSVFVLQCPIYFIMAWNILWYKMQENNIKEEKRWDVKY